MVFFKVGRLLKARLELSLALDGRLADDASAGDGTQSEVGLRADLTAYLRLAVEGTHLDNVQVRPHRRWVERYAAREAWVDRSPEDASEVAEHLSDLPSAVRDDDEDAKRFDLLVLWLQLAQLAQPNAEPSFVRLRSRVQAI